VKNEALAEKFAELSTPLVFDAARLKIPFRVAPCGIAPVIPGTRAAGRVLPAKTFRERTATRCATTFPMIKHFDFD